RNQTPLRRFAPQPVARFARSAVGFAPRPPTTFTLGDFALRVYTTKFRIRVNRTSRLREWWASLWVSTRRCWSGWPYSQDRTGVVNRLPGIRVSDRTPLARALLQLRVNLWIARHEDENAPPA